MTEVLSISQPDGHAHFGSSLPHQSSQTSLLLQSPSAYSRSTPNLNSRYTTINYETRLPASAPSSAPSSPRLAAPEFSNQPSYMSTPSSSLSLDENTTQEDEEVCFPLYDDGGYFHEVDNTYPSSRSELVETDSPREPPVTPVAPSTPHQFEPDQTAVDDMAIKSEPTRHVDYLSHSWKEEDIWSSWRHIVARRNLYSNSRRLENASWRTWAKAKDQLKTISPDTLNWYVGIWRSF